MKDGNVSDLYSSFSDKHGLAMTVGRWPQVSDRISKEPSKGIRARGKRSGLMVTKTVKKMQGR